MQVTRLARELLVTLCVAIVLVVGARLRATVGQQADEFGPRDLLSSPPFDRITLIDGTVLEVEPVSPRPLPPYDARKDPGRRTRPAKKDAPKKENVLINEKGELVVLDDEAEPAADDPSIEIAVKPLAEPNVFKIRRAAIKSLVYFEDLLLAEGDRLVSQKEFARAFEHFLAVKSRVPDWQGLDPRVNRLLFAEGTEAISSNEVERGIRLLGELHARDRAYPGLSDALASAYGGRVERAFQEAAFVEGRRELRDLEALVGEHRVVSALRQRFVERAEGHRQAAGNAESPAQRLDALTAAARVWPALEGLKAEYEAAFKALPTLSVGVSDVPPALGPWNQSAAQERVGSLIYRPILAADDEASMRGQSEGQLAASMEVADLGRKLVLNLREGPTWNHGERPLSVADLVRTFTDATYPGSPLYLARWADLLDRVEISGPRSVSVYLRRPPLKPAFWFLRPAAPAHAGRDARLPGAGGPGALVTNGPFSPQPRASASESEPLVLMAAPSSTSPIRRLKEVTFDEAKDAIRALVQGDIDLLEHVPPGEVGELEARERIKLGRYSQPRIHLIAVDGRVPVLSSRTLRRGLSYAIDRKTLLDELAGQRGAEDDVTSVSDGVSPRGGYADAPGVAPLGFDPVLGRMLVAAARKELDAGPVQLTLDYPALPEARQVVPRLVEAWKRVGVTVTPRELPPSLLESRLRSGASFELAYRVVTCEEPIVGLGPLICPGYDAPASTDALSSIASPLIVQLLLRLEQAPEFPTARGLAIEVDRRARDELPVLPLWQVRDHYAWQANLTGPADEANSLYQGVEKWNIEPAYPMEP